MPIEASQRVVFLKKIHLFHGLSDEQVAAVAAELGEMTFPADTDILREGEGGDSFYLLYQGSVQVTQSGRTQPIATLVAGDYFGEEALLARRRRTATVTASEDSHVLVLTYDQFQSLLKHVPRLRPNFEVTVASRRLARQKRFRWLEPDEVIYFLARKHPVLLYEAMIAPAVAMLAPVILLVIASMTKGTVPGFLSTTLLWMGGIFFLGIVGWIVWRVVDWGNDYYIVTNQRVIWLEKVVGLYDSRQEAPLSTVLSVGVQTDQLGRMLDYGNVIIRTFIGKIPFNHVAHPHQAAALIEEHWGRAKEVSRRTDTQQMKQAIRQRLGMPVEEVAPSSHKAEELVAQSPYKPGPLERLFSNLFKLRFEAKGTITYRKHWFVLITQVWMPSVVILLGLASVIWRSVHLLHNPTGREGVDTYISLAVILIVFALLWWIYQYVDWRNDIFQVTEDQILDIDKTPLGREERKSAPLDNILTTESERRGFLKVLLNYGNVFITVGGAQLVFKDVFDPPSVQQDIDRRREARIERKKQAEALAERERVADWFAEYHRSVEELHSDQEPQKSVDEDQEDEDQEEDKVQ
jgi:uncharacterized membrane protein YdbT with pleckstrin-like domain